MPNRPMIAPLKGGIQDASPYSIRLPDHISAEQFNRECLELFSKNQVLQTMDRQRSESIRRQDEGVAMVAQLVVDARAKVAEATAAYYEAKKNLMAARIACTRAETKKPPRVFGIKSLDERIRKKKISLIKHHADRQWAKAREKFTRQWVSGAAAKFIEATSLKL